MSGLRKLPTLMPEMECVLMADGAKGKALQAYRNTMYGFKMASTRESSEHLFVRDWTSNILPGHHFIDYETMRKAHNAKIEELQNG